MVEAPSRIPTPVLGDTAVPTLVLNAIHATGAGFRKVAYATWDLDAGGLVNTLYLNVILGNLGKGSL